MSNPFDNKIKESLENFEMPYDANAWAAFETQLPQSGGAASGISQLGWKIAALFAVIATVATSVWYLNSDNELNQGDSITTEKVEITQEQTVTKENSSTPSEPTPVTEKSKQVIPSEKTQIADSQKIVENARESSTETMNTDSETIAKSNEEQAPIAEKKATLPVKNSTIEKAEAKPLIASFIPSSLKVCAGEDVSFINESSDMKAQMTWDFGDGTASKELNPSHSFVIAGNYSVTLKTENNTKMADKTVNITVNPSPTVSLEASQKLEGYDAIPFYHFETILQPTETANWSFSDGLIAKGASADHLFRNAGKSDVTLTIRNNLGCSSSESWNIENRKAFDLLAPTGFTPDDNGTNEAFMLGALPDMQVPFEMVIRNQKGQEVYKTESASEPWNGRLHNNGNKLDAGIYVWTVILKTEIAAKKTFNGTITLKR